MIENIPFENCYRKQPSTFCLQFSSVVLSSLVSWVLPALWVVGSTISINFSKSEQPKLQSRAATPPSSSPWTPLLSQRDWLIEGQDSFSDVCPGRCQETSTHTELTKLSCSLSTYRRNPIRLGAGLYSSTCVLWALCCGTCQSAPKACPLSSMPASAAHQGLTIGCARPRSNIRCRRCWTAYPLAM
jgi:hypothetical protein